MKKWILTLSAALVCGWSYAQTDGSANAEQQTDYTAAGAVVPRYVSSEEPASTDWLPAFTRVAIDGPMKVRFVKIPKTEGPRIAYDTKGFYTSRFKAEVDKNGCLRIGERTDAKRKSTTEVTVYYHTIENLSAARADLTFAEPLDTPVIDVSFSSGATVDLPLDVLDLKLDITGKCRITLTGKARYLDLAVSTGKLDAEGLTVMSAAVSAVQGAEVRLDVTERLQAEAAGSSSIFYKGEPVVVRGRTSVFGGEIISEK